MLLKGVTYTYEDLSPLYFLITGYTEKKKLSSYEGIPWTNNKGIAQLSINQAKISNLILKVNVIQRSRSDSV